MRYVWDEGTRGGRAGGGVRGGTTQTPQETIQYTQNTYIKCIISLVYKGRGGGQQEVRGQGRGGGRKEEKGRLEFNRVAISRAKGFVLKLINFIKRIG